MGKYAKAPAKKGGKKILVIVLAVIAAVLVALVAAAGFVAIRYHIVDARFYAKDSQVLDLRSGWRSRRNSLPEPKCHGRFQRTYQC